MYHRALLNLWCIDVLHSPGATLCWLFCLTFFYVNPLSFNLCQLLTSVRDFLHVPECLSSIRDRRTSVQSGGRGSFCFWGTRSKTFPVGCFGSMKRYAAVELPRHNGESSLTIGHSSTRGTGEKREITSSVDVWSWIFPLSQKQMYGMRCVADHAFLKGITPLISIALEPNLTGRGLCHVFFHHAE